MSRSKNEILKEDEIRPAYLMQDQNKWFLEDLHRLLRHKNEFVRVPCPACGSGSSVRTFEKYEMTYETCSDCKTMYINPRPTPKMLEEYHSSSKHYKYWNEHVFPASEKVRRDKIFQPRVKKLAEICKRYKIRKDMLMEVGAGFGTFCEEIKLSRLFKHVIAVEPTPGLAESCRQRGLDVINKPIEKVRSKSGTVDVIASFEVIEHLFCPVDFINSCAQMLKPKGLIVLTCPNVKGFDIATLQSLSNAVDTEHINYFHPASLSHLLGECGFEVLEVSTPGKLDAELVRKKILSKEFDVSRQLFLKQVLVNEWERLGRPFQDFLAQNMLSSHMWIVGRKQK